MKKIFSLSLCMTFLLFALISCQDLSNNTSYNNKTGAAFSYVDITDKGYAPRWPDPLNIPVCWEPLDDMNDLQKESIVQPTYLNKARIARIVTNQFLKSGIHFTGWRSCSSSSKGIRIKIKYWYGSSKTKGFGTENNGVKDGMILNWYSPREEAHAKLAFGFNKRNNKFNRIINTALHEFGHALGLHHEMSRPDDLECSEQDYTMGIGENKNVQSLGDYISNSFMSYCRDLYSTELSDADIEGIKNYYNNSIATILNGPRGTKNLPEHTFYISGNEIDAYRYKINRADSIDCNDPAEYSEEINTEKPIVEELVSLGNGPIRLCVVGKHKSGQWQDFKAYTSWYWIQDLTPPASLKVINKSENKTRLELYIDDDDVERVKYKIGNDIDCNDPTGYGNFKDYKQLAYFLGKTSELTLPITLDLPSDTNNFKVCIIAKDKAGNEQSYSNATEYIYTEEEPEI